MTQIEVVQSSHDLIAIIVILFISAFFLLYILLSFSISGFSTIDRLDV